MPTYSTESSVALVQCTVHRRDRFSRVKRSEVMSKIRSKNTGLDRTMARLLRSGGLSFQSYPKIEGNPDFLVGTNVALFCDSSFWHGRDWPILRRQLANGNNPDYWVAHIKKNRERDRRVTRTLGRMGYRVLRLWDEEIFKAPDDCLRRVRRSLVGVVKIPIQSLLTKEKCEEHNSTRHKKNERCNPRTALLL